MNNTQKTVLGLASVGTLIGIIAFASKSEASTPHTKFKIGDHITGIPVLPTNAIYIIKGVNITDGTYYMVQLFNGQEFYPDFYSITAIDANYILVNT